MVRKVYLKAVGEGVLLEDTRSNVEKTYDRVTLEANSFGGILRLWKGGRKAREYAIDIANRDLAMQTVQNVRQGAYGIVKVN